MARFRRLNAGIDPVRPSEGSALNERFERNDEETSKLITKLIVALTCEYTRAYTETKEENAFKLDSENAGEIVEGLRIERSPFELHETPATQPAKLPAEHVNVEFARHTEAFLNKFSETQNHPKTRETLYGVRCALCALWCVHCVVCALCDALCAP